MKGSANLKKVDCDLFITAKDLLRMGYPQASVQVRLRLGEKTVRKIARSETLSDYCRQVEEERIKKIAARRKWYAADQSIKAIYDGQEDYAEKPRVMVFRNKEVLGWPIIVLALIGVAAVVIAALIILINLIVRNEVL